MSLLGKRHYKRSHKMLLRQKHNAMAQMSYWRVAYCKMRAALEARIKHNSLESTKSRKQGRTLLLATFSLVPRLSCGGGGKRAWYTLFVHAPSSLGNLHTTPLH